MSRKKYKYIERAVLWYCRECGGYNLHPLDWEEFDCINCGHLYHALAAGEIAKEKME